ncbi:DUF7519 family protein [Halorientalis pallida]|uniref:DUF7519 family protein n=1 Tax=Halorientalis pallida TaxID=2479928 RepID=UPI003C6EC173
MTDHATRFGRRVALAVAVVAALGLGAAVGSPLSALVGVGGALLVARSAAALGSDATAIRTAGSLGLAVGGLALLWPLGYGLFEGGLAVTVCVSLAVLAVGVDAVAGDVTALGRHLFRTTVHSGIVLFLVAMVGLLVTAGLVPATGRAVAAVLPLSAWPSLALLVALQLQALAVVLALDLATAILESWVGDTTDRVEGVLADLADLGVSVTDVSRRYWWALAGQLLLLSLVPRQFDAALAALPVLGEAVRVALASGVLHLPLAAVACLVLAVLAAEVGRRLLAEWLAPSPPHTLAYAAGGVAVSLVTVVVAAVPGALARFGVAVAPPAVAAVVPLVVLAALVAVLLVYGAMAVLVRLRSVPDGAPGFALGAALLVGGALLAARTVFPPVAFAAVAAAFVVWDVGATAADLGRTVGPDAPTQRGEFVHAAASVLVGAVAVGLAWVALFAVGPLTAAIPRWRATLSLALALGALVAFGLALSD